MKISLETQHLEDVNDCQYDYYGTQVASCDNNGCVEVSQVNANGEIGNQLIFQAHEGPAWAVAWAHPKYENVLATCGYDNKVKLWKREQTGYQLAFQEQLGGSVNCIAWAPWEYGLILAAGTADGKIEIYTKTKDQWVGFGFLAHSDAVNGISWAPQIEAQLEKGQLAPKRLVSGSSDHSVKVWEFRENEAKPHCTEVGQHLDWVRDVAWCQSIGHTSMIASCSEDKTCVVWKPDAKKGFHATKIQFSVPLWKVSWSLTGCLLAVSGGDDETHVMLEDPSGEWKEMAMEE